MSKGPAASPGSVRRRLWLSVALSVAALVCGLLAFGALAALKKPPASREQAAKTYNVEVFDVERRDLPEVITSFGTARADREVVVSAEVAGQIAVVHPRLKVGEIVSPTGESAGATDHFLVRIDKSTYETRVRQAENRVKQDDEELGQIEQEIENDTRLLKQARADLELYRKEYERIRGLHERGAAARSDLDKARLELQRYETLVTRSENDQKLLPLRRKQLQARKETNEADLQAIRLDLGRTDVAAPFAGVISEVMVERGQYVRVGDPLVRLTDVSVVEIPVPVTLEDYAKLEPVVRSSRHEDDLPHVELAAHETAAVLRRGRVVRIGPKADELTRTVNVFVEVDNDLETLAPYERRTRILPGMFVHARIEGPVLKDAVAVPREAIHGGKVFVANGEGRAESRAVTLLQTLQTLAVVEGLGGGEQVILTNLDVIYDGATVRARRLRTRRSTTSSTATRPGSSAPRWPGMGDGGASGRR